MRKYINIPYKTARAAKNNPLLMDLLCLSVSIKKMSGASRYRFVNIRKFSYDFGLSGTKAKYLFNQAKSNKHLFSYDEKNQVLTAKTFKNLRKITNNRFGKKVYHMYCMKIKDDSVFKVGKIKAEIRKLLLLCAVNAIVRADKFVFRVNVPCHVSGVSLSQQHLCNIAGIDRKTLVKYLKELEGEGRITIKKGKVSELVKNVDKSVILQARRKNKYVVPVGKGYGLVCYMTLYSIEDRSVNKLFCNIIYGSKLRHTENKSEKKEEEKSDVDKYFEQNDR